MHRSRNIANKIYIYVHEKDVSIKTNLTPEFFSNAWLTIEQNGTITVRGSNGEGYAWDGCSPKTIILDLIFGTPDGRLDLRTEKPITYFTSMIHDALYQFKEEVGISRKETDILFYLTLKEAKFKWSFIYYLGVRIGGWLYGKWKNKSAAKNIQVSERSWLAA